MRILYVSKHYIVGFINQFFCNSRIVLCTISLLALLVGVAINHSIDQLHIISQVPTSHKVVALTIDDGPHYKVTPEILAVLKQKQVKATFFVLGQNVEEFPQLLAQEVADGHEIGAHTYSHPKLSTLDLDRIADEFDKAEKVITAVAPKPVLFRPPGGFYDKKVITTAHEKGYSVVLWSVDPHDWSRPPAEKVVNTVIHDIKPGSIILLHDGQYPLPTPQALGIIIDRLQEQGYKFVTVSELLQYNEVQSTFHFFDYVFR